ncbi:MAG: hypothetical protein KGH82_01670 [Candidatus Micrarchaeota archaeon]|nr:hypothetical protein [Candidatus Micrarchaeota archaeon]
MPFPTKKLKSGQIINMLEDRIKLKAGYYDLGLHQFQKLVLEEGTELNIAIVNDYKLGAEACMIIFLGEKMDITQTLNILLSLRGDVELLEATKSSANKIANMAMGR